MTDFAFPGRVSRTTGAVSGKTAPFGVISFNIRVGHAPDGENAWPFRRPLVKSFLREGRADLYGFQEVLPEVAEELRTMLGPDYLCLGRGREADGGGEQVMIAVNQRRFTVRSYGHFMLSPTPFVPGSRFAYSGKYPRICTWAEVTDRQSDHSFVFFNTHLDHQSLRAAEDGLGVILEAVRQAGPSLVVGDFNAQPDQVSAWTKGLKDASCLPEGCPTYHNYGREAIKIDYLLCTAEFTFGQPSTQRRKQGNVWLSDHDPIGNTFQL